MTFSARMNNLTTAVFGRSQENETGAITAQLSEISRRLDSLERSLQPNSSLSAEEFNHMERFRLEQRMLADWQGADRVKLVNKLRRFLSKLRPMKVIGRNKARFGSKNDGGYILLDDFNNIDTVLSFGVEQNAEFDLEIAKRQIYVRQYDHTIAAAPVQHPFIIWEKKKIAPLLTEETETLSNIIRQCDKGRPAPSNCSGPVSWTEGCGELTHWR